MGRERLTLVQVYDPTDGSKVKEEECFYSDSQEITDKETLVIMGDLNLLAPNIHICGSNPEYC